MRKCSDLHILHIGAFPPYQFKQWDKVAGPCPFNLHGCPHYVDTR